MRTTLDIDDELLAAAKELARRQGTTAGRVVSDLLRRALTTPENASGEVREPEALYGFRPFPNRGGIVTDEKIEKLRDEEGI
ncbi:MAG: CopG family transcriptional regulator [Wenzhouxiangellaceae bacterium]